MATEGGPLATSFNSDRFRQAANSLGTQWARIRPTWLAEFSSPEIALFALAVVLYLISRLWAIDSFPIFFYSDEADNVWYGEQALQRGLVGQDNSWPEVYVEWDTNRWTPALTIYIYGLVAAAFGHSIFITRATSALITLGGMLAVGWILRDFFQSRFWWAGILLGIAIPAWFLYSRTAFDTVAATSLYAVFLYCYMLYRLRSGRYLPLAVGAGAAAFYSYSNAQAQIGLLAIMLLVSDFGYHKANASMWLRTLPLAALLAMPFLEFRWLHPGALIEHLKAIDSYWLSQLPLAAKLSQYAHNYLQGLSPVYWFAPQNGESKILPDQHIPGTGNLGIAMLPLVAAGLYVALRYLRSPLFRILLLSLLVIPVGAAMDTIEITRVLAMIVPALILAVLGLEWIVSKMGFLSQRMQTGLVLLVLSVLGMARLHDGLVHGPTWYNDYGLEGMQFGAKAVFQDTIPALLAQDPNVKVVMSTTWANNVDQYPRFFLSDSDQSRISFGNVKDFLASRQPVDDMIVGMTASEYATAQASPVLKPMRMVKMIPAPDGKPAFYFARLSYTDDAEAIFEKELFTRHQLVEETLNLFGQMVQVYHSVFGDGNIANVFDGNTDTLVRGDRVNPIRFELHFSQPIRIQDVSLTTGSMQDFTVSMQLTPASGGSQYTSAPRYVGLGPDPTVEVAIPSGGFLVSELQVQVTDNLAGPDALIHIREITLR